VYTNEQNFLFHTLLMKSGLPKSLIEVPETQSAFHLPAQRNAFPMFAKKSFRSAPRFIL
jgi:hypothetical protein